MTGFGAHELISTDDYPDFVIPLARAVAAGDVDRGIALYIVYQPLTHIMQ